MVSSRTVILIGFPIMLLILCLGLFDWLMAGAQQHRLQYRKQRENELALLLETAETLLSAREDRHRLEIDRAELAAKEACTQKAQTAAEFTAAQLKKILANNPSRRPASEDLVSRMVATLGLLAPEEDALPAPQTPTEALKALKPEWTALLSSPDTDLLLSDQDQNEIFRIGFTPGDRTNLIQETRRLSFTWNRLESYLILTVYQKRPESLPLPLEERYKALTSSPRFNALLTEGVTLELIDLKTDQRQTLPVGSRAIEEASPENLNIWQTIAPSETGEEGIRLLLASKPETTDHTALIAELAMTEPDLSSWGGAMIQNQPVLALMPFLALGLTIGAALWAFQRRTPPPAKDVKTQTAPRTSPSAVHLIRKGNRTVPEENRMLLADFDQPGERLRLKSLPLEKDEDNPVMPVRESNLLRLRTLYQIDPESRTRLSHQVRSQVLRDLLARVNHSREPMVKR